MIGENYVTFLGPENFVRFEKHQKAFPGALRGAFRAREVLGSFEKRTPGLSISPFYSMMGKNKPIDNRRTSNNTFQAQLISLSMS